MMMFLQKTPKRIVITILLLICHRSQYSHINHVTVTATTTATTLKAVEDDWMDNHWLESFLLDPPVSTTATSSSTSSTKNKPSLKDFAQYSGYLNGTNPDYGCCGCRRPIGDSNSNTPTTTTPLQDDRVDICQLHYWFITEHDDDINDTNNDNTTTNNNHSRPEKPIIAWFNGGPGASSIIGLLQEVGPFLIATTPNNNNNKDDDPKLVWNPYRWTKMAHLLIIENPVGVGYSYCRSTATTGSTSTSSSEGNSNISSNHINQQTVPPSPPSPPCHNTDDTTAQMTLHALVDFYTRKLPGMMSNISRTNSKHHQFHPPPLYLMGESYAGVYIPTLARDILQYNQEKKNHRPSNDTATANTTTTKTTIPLQGIAVGDPCTDSTSQSPYMDPLWYAHQYGLVDDSIYTTLRNDPSCRLYYQRLERQRRKDDAVTSNDSDAFTSNPLLSVVQTDEYQKDDHTKVDDECRLAYRKYLLSSSRGISASKHWNYSYIDRYALHGFVTDQVERHTEAFMNHPSVRQALHIPEFVYASNVASYWKIHSTSDTMVYTKQYNACNHEPQNVAPPSSSSFSSSSSSMIDIYHIILPQLPAGAWIYNGNTDPALSYEGTRIAVKAMGYPEIDGGSYRPWFYHHTHTSISFLQSKSILYGTEHLVVSDTVGIQLGGHVTNYAVRPGEPPRLSFVTVHGSGHLVPQNRPQSSYHMISKFLQHGCCLSPLLPSNATLSAIRNDTELLLQTINNWTLLAKSSEYVQH